MARPKYRRKKGRDTWHFCTNCSNWPKLSYDSNNSKPKNGEFCNECKAKEKAKKCQ